MTHFTHAWIIWSIVNIKVLIIAASRLQSCFFNPWENDRDTFTDLLWQTDINQVSKQEAGDRRLHSPPPWSLDNQSVQSQDRWTGQRRRGGRGGDTKTQPPHKSQTKWVCTMLNCKDRQRCYDRRCGSKGPKCERHDVMLSRCLNNHSLRQTPTCSKAEFYLL